MTSIENLHKFLTEPTDSVTTFWRQVALDTLGVELEDQETTSEDVIAVRLHTENLALRAQLEKALKFVRLVAEEWYVQGEMYEECFFCQEPSPTEDEDHREDCEVLAAKQFLQELKETSHGRME